jgi:hypothetical protein
MRDINSEDFILREIISKSKLEIPFSDFEDNVMRSIDKRFVKKESLRRDFKLSCFFFITGSIFGIIVSIILPIFQRSILGISSEKLSIIFMVIFSLVFLTQLESLMNLYTRLKNNTKR